MRLATSLVVWNVNWVASVIYALIDVSAQGVLVPSQTFKKNPGLTPQFFSLRFTAVGWCGTEDWLS